ncbi:MAG: polyphosphate kinase 2 family protein [Planctomycetaceae bacterium]|nr:polyphosphate kinase 2 family protein [Planctomycetaceae bacterium]
MPDTHLVKPGKPVLLSELSTRGKDFHADRSQAEREFKQLRKELIEWQVRLYAEGRQSLLVVLQAMDAGGKDGTIRNITKGLNPQGVRVASFKKPSTEELSHDFLWRIHRRTPARGMIGIFNRSHYEDVLVVRVHNYVSDTVWQPRFELINQFENNLVAAGTTIVKLFLHISKEEQKERFQDRLDEPDKHWKFDRDDLNKRRLWDDYQLAFQDMLNNCSTTSAPWYAIPGDQKWYRNLAIMRILVDTLRGMNPEYPESEDLTGITID